MNEKKQEFAYLITHEYGNVVDGITYDEESAKYLVDALNNNCDKSNKCMRCRESLFEFGEEHCEKAEIRFNSSGRGSRCTIYCAHDVNDELNDCYIKSPDRYDYQKISVLDVKKMLGEG